MELGRRASKVSVRDPSKRKKMPDNSFETQSNENRSPQNSASDQSSVSLNVSSLISLCALGLLVAFFLPWINVLLIKPSGFELAKQEGKYLLLWAIPAFSAITFFAGLAKAGQKSIAQATGCLPFFFLMVAIYTDGTDILKTLDYGAYTSLAMGLGLMLLPSRLK